MGEPLDTGQRLIPAATTVLQPGARYFRLVDAFNFLDQSPYVAQLQAQVNTLHSQVVTLQGQVATLQSQVAALQAQIDGLNVGGVGGPAAGAPTAGLAVTINGTPYHMQLYA